MSEKKIVQLEDRVPKLKVQRRRRANRRFYVLVLILSILIVGVAYLQSPFSRVQAININGNVFLTDEEILGAIAISPGDSIWSMKKEAVITQLKEQPEIKDAIIERKLPSTLTITVTEYRPVAFVMEESEFVPILETGQPLTKGSDAIQAIDAPLLSNFKDKAVREKLVEELSKLDSSVRSSISEITSTPRETDPYNITMFMNDGFEVRASILTFREKLNYYPTIVNQLNPDIRGYIDLEVGTFFKSYETPQVEGEGTNEEESSE
ncbi:cell division protein FtsQ/DivIB [Mangrovibacillus cuniculi]|uniref:Cell division protein DivIB n=1 Tax=Mangrovibacillus cuniculi TaxID=2593652 RepID=A0A7S8CA83_9BACI|nr:FtsQ-type POTRA domain-containing protein [Mangrovibacillus cuniculi]QPC46259.1 FtsQ-type POTRA domain-containing protein [Mangrovibacillus cuniculi]